MAGLLAVLSLLLPAPASAHTDRELDDWQAGWLTRAVAVVEDPLSLSLLMAEWWAMAERHSCQMLGDCPKPEPQPSTRRGFSGSVEQWRSLVTSYFGPAKADKALCTMKGESGGNPYADNPRSTARGLFQILISWTSVYGVSYADLYDPATNVRIAADLQARYGWSQFNAAARC